MNRTSVRTTTFAAPLVGLALVLSACGSGSDTAAPAPATQASVQGISTQFNDADAAFIKDMVPHHSGALDMAELAPTRAASAEVKALAAQIAAAQEPEITRMEAMSMAWKVDLPAGGHSMGGGASMGGGMSMGGDDVAALTPLSGAAFDKEWLTRMIAHHTSAVSMSEVELAQGENPQGKELAQQIIAAQKAEITTMNGLLAAL